MTIIDDKLRYEKLQDNINREAAKISALSSEKIDKYEYYTGEGVLPPDQKSLKEQAKFTYSPLNKVFEKQIKTIEDQGKKQMKAIEDHVKQLVASDELIKKDFNINNDSVPFEKLFNKLVEIFF